MKNYLYKSKYNYVNLWGEFTVQYYRYIFINNTLYKIVMCCPTTHNNFYLGVINMDKKHNIVYKITNTQNGHYYIGKHTTNNINDGYMGSGKLITQAIEKYGNENFKKEILFDFKTEQEAYEKEKELIPLEKTHTFDENCYNLIEGGNSGSMTEETKEKIRQSNKKYCGEKHSQYGTHRTQETKEKISKSLQLKTSGELNGMFGKKLQDCMSNEKYEKWKTTRKGCSIYNNGIKEVFVKPDEQPPEGFVKGRLPSSLNGINQYNKKHKMSKESKMKMIKTKQKNGTLKRSPESIKKQIETRKKRNISSITTSNYKWYHNETQEKLFSPNDIIPPNWIPGRIRFKNYKWYNNGIISKYLDSSKPIPDGFVEGRILK